MLVKSIIAAGIQDLGILINSQTAICRRSKSNSNMEISHLLLWDAFALQ